MSTNSKSDSAASGKMVPMTLAQNSIDYISFRRSSDIMRVSSIC